MRLSFIRDVDPANRPMHRRLIGFVLPLILLACSSDSNNTNLTQSADDTVNGFHLVSSTTYDQFDNIFYTSERRYDFDLNRIDVSSTIFGSDDFGTMDQVRINQEYFDESGRLTVRETSDETDLFTETYTFEDDGLITSRVTTGTISETADFEYDATGKLLRVIRNSPAGVSAKTITYDDNGIIDTTLVEESSSNDVIGMSASNTTTTTFTYNSQGQIVRTEKLSSNEEILAITNIYTYDSNGNIVERISQGSGFYDRTVYAYELNQKPVYNFWLRKFKYFP